MKTTQTSLTKETWLEIGWESIVIALICSLDLLSTLWLLGIGWATEANPLMARLLDHSVWLFCGVKMGTVFLLIAVAEWYRKYNPAFVRRMMRFSITAYLALYVALVLRINLA